MCAAADVCVSRKQAQKRGATAVVPRGCSCPPAVRARAERSHHRRREARFEALARGQLGGVGLNVLWDEPGDPDDPLYRDPRVMALPHVAGSPEEAFARIAAIAVDNVRRPRERRAAAASRGLARHDDRQRFDVDDAVVRAERDVAGERTDSCNRHLLRAHRAYRCARSTLR